MLSRRERYDYTDIHPKELMLISAGHYLWGLVRRDRRKNGRWLPQSDPLWKALETIWQAKRELRAELKHKRSISAAKVREHFKKAKMRVIE